MSDEEEKQEEGFKVKDKRRFDAEGNVKDEESAAASVKAEGEDFVMKDSPTETEGYEADSSIDFSSFVLSLGTQALMQMGVMPSPDGVEIPKNRVAAKQTIDILGMIRDKTEGNLSDTEARMMDEILHNLRMSYISEQ